MCVPRWHPSGALIKIKSKTLPKEPVEVRGRLSAPTGCAARVAGLAAPPPSRATSSSSRLGSGAHPLQWRDSCPHSHRGILRVHQATSGSSMTTPPIDVPSSIRHGLLSANAAALGLDVQMQGGDMRRAIHWLCSTRQCSLLSILQLQPRGVRCNQRCCRAAWPRTRSESKRCAEWYALCANRAHRAHTVCLV